MGDEFEGALATGGLGLADEADPRAHSFSSTVSGSSGVQSRVTSTSS